MKVFAAVDVGGTYIKAMIAGVNLEPIVHVRIETERRFGIEHVLHRIVVAIETMLARAGLARAELEGIGIGFPGFIDAESKTGIRSWRFGYENRKLTESIERHFRVPVFLDNDAHVHALGETRFGSAKHCANVVCLILGTGLGTGIVANGQLLRGKSNLAAEVAHLTIAADGGLPCACGRTGCAQQYVSGEAMLAFAKTLLAKRPDSALWDMIRGDLNRLSVEMLDEASNLGDAVSLAVIDRIVHYAAVVVSSLCILFNPELVVIGGGISNLGNKLLVPLAERVNRSLMDPSQRCPIVKSVLGQDAGVYGALYLAAEGTGHC
jgi:glucokinase